MYWLALVCALLALAFFFRWFGLAFTVGDAMEAAKDGAPYTTSDIAGFRVMDTIARHWFDAALGSFTICLVLVFAGRLQRRKA
jgi:hypothetical protein